MYKLDHQNMKARLLKDFVMVCWNTANDVIQYSEFLPKSASYKANIKCKDMYIDYD